MNNKAETKPDHKDIRLRTRIYKLDGTIADIRKKVEEIISRQTTYFQRWKVIATTEDSVIAEVPVLFFTDDLKVWIKTSGFQGKFEINIKSSSRVGKSDLGENKRHILQLIKEMDKQFEPLSLGK